MIVFTDYLYTGVGGVGQLISNMVLEINNRGYQSKLYSSKESYEYKRLMQLNADFIHIDSDIVDLKRLPNYIDSIDVFFITSITASTVFDNIGSLNNKILFYSVHPDTFFVYPKLLGIFFPMKHFVKKMVKNLQFNHSLYFMDGSNIDGINKHGANIDKSVANFLPVPVFSELKLHRDYIVLVDGAINITYIGRGNDDWKIFPVIKVLQDLNSCSFHNIKLTIITDKNDLFISMIGKYVTNNTIKLDFINGMYGKDLESYLYNNSTLHISMGTAALEGAKIGIPTILIDYSRKLFPNNYRYKWLFQSKCYSLADDITNRLDFDDGETLFDIITSIQKSQKFAELSDLCYDYVISNHSIVSFVDNIEDSICKLNFSVSDYCNLSFHKVLKLKDLFKKILFH